MRRPRLQTVRWILVLRPPRELPRARYSNPIFGARRVRVAANNGGVDDQVFEVRTIGHRLKDAPPDAFRLRQLKL